MGADQCLILPGKTTGRTETTRQYNYARGRHLRLEFAHFNANGGNIGFILYNLQPKVKLSFA